MFSRKRQFSSPTDATKHAEATGGVCKEIAKEEYLNRLERFHGADSPKMQNVLFIVLVVYVMHIALPRSAHQNPSRAGLHTWISRTHSDLSTFEAVRRRVGLGSGSRIE